MTIAYESAIKVLEETLRHSDFACKESDRLSEAEYADINSALGVLILASIDEKE